MNARKLFLTFFITSVFLASCGKGNETATAKQNNSKDTKISEKASQTNVTWYSDWNKGMEAAKKEQKPILVDFYAEWCKWCHVMDDKTFSAPEIKKRFGTGWITIRIDTEERNKTGTVYIDDSANALAYIKGEKGNFKEKNLSHGQLLQFFGSNALPTFLFIDREGKPLTKISSYIPKEDFAVILDFFQEEAYENTSFEDYKKSKPGKGS